jgi:hypothetical protein
VVELQRRVAGFQDAQHFVTQHADQRRCPAPLAARIPQPLHQLLGGGDADIG